MSKYDPPGTQRPVPVPTALSEPYWQACRQEKLTYQCCNDCNAIMFPPEPACPSCMSTNLGWRTSKGTGTVYSYSVLHREPSANFPLPSVFAIVDVDEGYSMFSSIVECDPDDAKIDMRVEVVFDQITPEINLPLFRRLHVA
jgi:uncharacterized OB-fold protein